MAKLAVSAFVSIVVRTTRINTKLEKLLLLALLSSSIIATAIRMSARALGIDHKNSAVLVTRYPLIVSDLMPAHIPAV
ncbi:hypothetical protein EDB89DRAFT_2000930, partial [Lactarius sanguifluus]